MISAACLGGDFWSPALQICYCQKFKNSTTNTGGTVKRRELKLDLEQKRGRSFTKITSRRRLRSSTSSEPVIPMSRLVTVGDQSFAVAGPRLRNTLSEDITSAPSLPVFRRKLKTQFVSAILSGHYIVACATCCARWLLRR